LAHKLSKDKYDFINIPMSSVDFQKLQVIVKDYQKANNSLVVVTFDCSYTDESKEFFTSLPEEQGRKAPYYAQQAFKKLKKEIKKWVRDVAKKSSIIGSIMSIPGDFGGDDEEIEPVV